MRFVAIRVAELAGSFAEFVGEPDLLAATAIGDKRDPFAIGGPTGIFVAPGGIGDTLGLAGASGDGEDLTVDDDGGAAVGRGEIEALSLVVNRDELGVVVFGIRF